MDSDRDGDGVDNSQDYYPDDPTASSQYNTPQPEPENVEIHIQP